MTILAFYETQREELVESMIDELLSPSGEFYPFSTENLSEALTQADMKTMLRLAVFAAASDELPGNPCSSRDLAICLRSIANTYWHNMARERAEKEIPSAEEMLAATTQINRRG